ncbi:MAG: MAPEG family protein [Wenzhouxiangellaceae bacterium]|nr:MAPEG family protein [Wenzhouxiangellaceae bacterium]
MIDIVLIYAALLALVLLALSLRVVRLRRQHQVGIGTGGVPELGRAVRAHANFCEYVPLALVLLVMIELAGGVPDWVLHGLGAGLVVGRLLHGVGLSGSAGPSRGRIAGTALTWAVLLVAAGIALGLGIAH